MMINRYITKPVEIEAIQYNGHNIKPIKKFVGDRVRSKLLSCPMDYEEVKSNADIMKNNPKIILVKEPFLLDDELREKVTKWVEWANNADEKEYNPLA